MDRSSSGLSIAYGVFAHDSAPDFIIRVQRVGRLRQQYHASTCANQRPSCCARRAGAWPHASGAHTGPQNRSTDFYAVSRARTWTRAFTRPYADTDAYASGGHGRHAGGKPAGIR